MMETIPRSPGTHIVGSRVIDSIRLCRDPRTGTQHIGNWASRVLYCWGYLENVKGFLHGDIFGIMERKMEINI